ncbi:hypothetical protein NPIL_289821 [Nephila pilipes]|uniref:Uncharacterized protein n=1 Tax=Nephila pilipes TaxID=299642 RepID=A0A8X6PWQ5_NEPPI|nr:hypothetical protein NPIL_289821 [Nephila pilipes]
MSHNFTSPPLGLLFGLSQPRPVEKCRYQLNDNNNFASFQMEREQLIVIYWTRRKSLVRKKNHVASGEILYYSLRGNEWMSKRSEICQVGIVRHTIGN